MALSWNLCDVKHWVKASCEGRRVTGWQASKACVWSERRQGRGIPRSWVSTGQGLCETGRYSLDSEGHLRESGAASAEADRGGIRSPARGMPADLEGTLSGVWFCRLPRLTLVTEWRVLQRLAFDKGYLCVWKQGTMPAFLTSSHISV